MRITLTMQDGRTVAVDGASLQEAKELLGLTSVTPTATNGAARHAPRLAAKNGAAKKPASADEAARWKTFVGKLSPGQRALLTHIANHPGPGVSVADLATATANGNPSGVSGYLRVIYLHANATGFENADVCLRTETWSGKTRLIKYAPGRLLAARGLHV